MTWTPAAQRAADRWARQRAKEIAKATREGSRAVLRRAAREKMGALETASLLKQTMGLDARSAQAVMNFRATLLKSGGRKQTIERAVMAYGDRKRLERAETIARFEIMEAINRGILEEINTGLKDGEITSRWKKQWIVTDTKSLCFMCAKMRNVEVGVKSTFLTLKGRVDGPTLHPKCRCTIVLVAPR